MHEREQLPAGSPSCTKHDAEGTDTQARKQGSIDGAPPRAARESSEGSGKLRCGVWPAADGDGGYAGRGGERRCRGGRGSGGKDLEAGGGCVHNAVSTVYKNEEIIVARGHVLQIQINLSLCRGHCSRR